jgi:hypothetical protein
MAARLTDVMVAFERMRPVPGGPCHHCWRFWVTIHSRLGICRATGEQTRGPFTGPAPAEAMSHARGNMRDMPSQTGYATTNATAVSGAGIVDQKRMHAARTYQWPGAPSRTESSPGRPLLGWPGAGRWRG